MALDCYGILYFSLRWVFQCAALSTTYHNIHVSFDLPLANSPVNPPAISRLFLFFFFVCKVFVVYSLSFRSVTRAHVEKEMHKRGIILNVHFTQREIES